MGKGGDIGKATELPPKMDELAGVKPAGVKPVKGMQTDFIWVETDEPHATRRKQILAAHPEVRELFGPDEYAVYKITAVVFGQLALAYLVRDAPWWFLVPFAYAVGAWFNHNLFLAIHELSHNLAFQTPLYNKLLGLFANIPIGIPMSVTFQKYHLEHHRYQGIEGVDMDVPTYAEGHYVTTTLAKLVWVILQLFFYAVRPVFVNPKPVGVWELSNLAVNVAADAAMLYFWGFKPIAYLLLASFLGGGLHPAAGHFIAEHYVFLQGQETYSYYGPLNFLLWHVGFHNEHHDFPRIPGSRLHKLKAMAPEFYDNLAFHTSWSRVIYNYITDPTVGPFSRVMRKRKPTTRAGAVTEASKAH